MMWVINLFLLLAKNKTRRSGLSMAPYPAYYQLPFTNYQLT